jgi:hypothetical protein
MGLIAVGDPTVPEYAICPDVTTALVGFKLYTAAAIIEAPEFIIHILNLILSLLLLLIGVKEIAKGTFVEPDVVPSSINPDFVDTGTNAPPDISIAGIAVSII